MATRVLLVPRAWARQAGQGIEDVSASGSTWGRECRARQAGFGRGPARGALTVPVACPHSTPPTMAPLFPVARQFGGGSSVTHAPLNRSQINPLGDEDQVKAPRKLPASFFFFFRVCWSAA